MKIGACRGKLGVEGVRVYIETGEESRGGMGVFREGRRRGEKGIGDKGIKGEGEKGRRDTW